MSNIEQEVKYPQYGAIAFLLPRLVKLYRSHTGSDDLPKRHFIDPFVVLSGYLIAQHEKVSEWADDFGDQSVPVFRDKTRPAYAYLMRCAAERFELDEDLAKSHTMIEIIETASRLKLRFSIAMAKALIDCVQLDASFTLIVLQKIPAYIEDNLSVRLPIRIFYARLSDYTAEDFRNIQRCYEHAIKRNKEEHERLILLTREHGGSKENERVLLTLKAQAQRLKKIRSACEEARKLAEGAVKKRGKTYHVPTLLTFFEQVHGGSSSQSIYRAVQEFEKEDHLLKRLHFHPGQSIDGSSRDLIYSKTTIFYPESRSSAVLGQKMNDDGNPIPLDKDEEPRWLGMDIIGLDHISATLTDSSASER